MAIEWSYSFAYFYLFTEEFNFVLNRKDCNVSKSSMELNPVPLNLSRDLPCEVLFQIASFLSAKNMLNLATTCKRLSAVINSDEAWETKVSEWIFKQDVRADILGTSAEDMMNILGLHTQRSTYQALVMLKIWPCGLWYNTDSSAAFSCQPQGKLLWVHSRTLNRSLRGTTKHTCLDVSVVRLLPNFDALRGGELNFPYPQFVECLKVETMFFSWTIRVHCEKGAFCSEVAMVDLMSNHNAWPPMEFKADPEDKTQFQLTWNHSDPWSVDEDVSTLNAPDSFWTFKRAGVVVHNQQQISPQLAPPPGLYYAFYGNHGAEIVQLERVEGTRYSALKLTGDPNVPATQISFQFDASTENAKPGPYNSDRDDPFQTSSGFRPVVTHLVNRTWPILVHIEDRPVCTVISNAQGQINRDPDVWSPEMVQATVVVYDYDLSTSSTYAAHDGVVHLVESKRAVFSVIFEDYGAPTRHVMDFYLCPHPSDS
jgi:hypothetical protein